MAISYKQALGRESDLIKQLNYLDQVICDEMNQQEQYDNLFRNEDSLFAPDVMYEQQNTEGFSFKNKDHNKNYKGSQQYKNKEEKDQELDSLDFNQFMRVPLNEITKNTRNKTKNRENSLECTFKPNILKKSNQMATNMQPSFERLTMPVRSTSKKMPYKPASKQLQKQYSKQRIQRLSKPRALKTQPAESQQYSKPITQKKYLAPRHSNYLDVAARNKLWEEQKQLKIQKLRKQEQQIRIKKQSSTFAPRLTEYKGEKLANLSNFGKEGIANYFQRLNFAKSKINNYSGKQNNNSFRKENTSPYCSTKASRTPRKDSKNGMEQKKQSQKIKYDEAVKELHRKLMSLNI